MSSPQYLLNDIFLHMILESKPGWMTDETERENENLWQSVTFVLPFLAMYVCCSFFLAF